MYLTQTASSQAFRLNKLVKTRFIKCLALGIVGLYSPGAWSDCPEPQLIAQQYIQSIGGKEVITKYSSKSAWQLSSKDMTAEQLRAVSPHLKFQEAVLNQLNVVDGKPTFKSVTCIYKSPSATYLLSLTHAENVGKVILDYRDGENAIKGGYVRQTAVLGTVDRDWDLDWEVKHVESQNLTWAVCPKSGGNNHCPFTTYNEFDNQALQSNGYWIDLGAALLAERMKFAQGPGQYCADPKCTAEIKIMNDVSQTAANWQRTWWRDKNWKCTVAPNGGKEVTTIPWPNYRFPHDPQGDWGCNPKK